MPSNKKYSILYGCKKNKKSNEFFLILFIVISTMQPVWAQLTPYKFNHLTVENGLSHTDALEVKQDKKGFIWIATFYGLCRYDGYRIKTFLNNIDESNSAFKNRIRSIYPDEDGKIWLLTEDGVQCFNSKSESFIPLKQQNNIGATHGYFKINKLKDQKLASLSQNTIRVFEIDGNSLNNVPLKFGKGLLVFDFTTDIKGNIWIASNNGIWILNTRMELQHCQIVLDQENNSSQRISKISFSNQGTLVLASGNDIVETTQTAMEILREKSTEIYGKKKYHIDLSPIEDILVDNHRNCWISTHQGLVQLDENWNKLQTITDKSQNNGLTSDYLGKLFLDRSDCLWICSYGGGVNIADLNAKQFYLIQRNPELSNTLPDNHISAILEENQDNVWIGTNLNGLCRYNLNTKDFFYINTNTGKLTLKSNEIRTLAVNKDKRLWIGTEKGIQVLNLSRLTFENLPGSDKFPNYAIENLATDYFGNIWFGSYGNGLGCIINENGKYKTIFYNISKHKEGRSLNRINSIYCDDNRPEVFISLTNGLERLIIGSDGKVNRFIQYRSSSAIKSISSNYIWQVQRQSDSVIWVGTLGGGLNKIVLKNHGEYSAVKYDMTQGVFNDVESLQTDNNGNVWIGGKGLQCFNPDLNKLTEYNAKDGLQGNSFKVGASYRGNSGRLYFGGVNGLNYFYPADISKNKIEANPLVTEIMVNNRPLSYNNVMPNAVKIDCNISYLKELQLNYKQDNFIIYFSSMHFANPEKCAYRYKLEGFDKDWKYTLSASAAYSNLDYKKYTFLLEASNNDGLWSGKHVKLTIDVLPPWWKTNLAEFIYSILFIAFCYGVYRYFQRLYWLKREFESNEIEAKRKEELHRQKESMQQQQLQFFTNISHEFRTPLTLILGPLEMILKKESDPQISYHLEGMQRNAKRMMDLIAELMNFKKISDNAITLKASPINIKECIREITKEFEQLALQRAVHFSTSFETEMTDCYADKHVLEKILYNLIDNAFKYSKNSGKISLTIFSDINQFKPTYKNEFKLLNNYRASKYIYYLVKDDGVGISEESINQIFDRYFRVNNTHIGSGVGLAIVKSLVELHKGDIYLYSQRNIGTEIVVGLPAQRDNYQFEEVSTLNDVLNNKTDLEKINGIQPAISEKIVIQPAIDSRTNSILIVEDNEELKSFLKLSLNQFYEVVEASNGQTALDLVARRKPDLIISDIMMPVKDGLELCKNIKETFETSHLPFILLTAKSDIDIQLEGVSFGADYYITKPFSMDLLLLTVQNIFCQRQKLRDLFSEGFYEDAAKLVQSEGDKKLMQKLIDLIDTNIEDEDLDIEFLCRELNASRSSLYEKVKNISGQSIGNFIRTARLKKALYIMTHEDVTLQEVIERVGINSSSYFSKAFKKEFGKTPSAFLKKIKMKA